MQRELASGLAIDRSDIVKVVDALAVAGLVDRARDAGDRRRVIDTPTPAGRSVLAEIQSDTRNVQEASCAVDRRRRHAAGRPVEAFLGTHQP
ncbi:MarR family transcriptional regulator [Streptomyces sp. NPDC051020]|uniref:MarR family transcriptional regulator n=1 Tax=Streptomyces sp. NPDC051020 TaxID=3155409 RepID=UPI003422F802